MNRLIKNWKDSGEFISYGPLGHQLFVKQMGNPGAPASKTLLLLHGFPESSFSYHGIVDGMMQTFERIVLFDMLGYGLSDKSLNYSYSLLEQADTAFSVWNYFNIKGGHLLAHDMGVSVATEILFRHEIGLTPSWFSDGLQSITFTNGSLVLGFAKLRVMQKILLSSMGKHFRYFVSYPIFEHQVKSAQGNDNLSKEDIQLLWEINTLQDGHKKTYLTIQYLNDRQKFEKVRWLPTLKQTTLPIHICWGKDDKVARVEMAHYIKNHICKNAKLSIMENMGHFCQTENPEKWIETINDFYGALFNT